VDDPASYLKLIRHAGGSSPFVKLHQAVDIGLKGSVIATRMIASHINSPLEARYWSMVPYRLGDPPHKQAIKFSARPQIWPESVHSRERTPDFLRATMIEQLTIGDAHFDFEVQTGTKTMSLEDSMTEWEETEAPFVKVATITIPAPGCSRHLSAMLLVKICRSTRGMRCLSTGHSARSIASGVLSTNPSRISASA